MPYKDKDKLYEAQKRYRKRKAEHLAQMKNEFPSLKVIVDEMVAQGLDKILREPLFVLEFYVRYGYQVRQWEKKWLKPPTSIPQKLKALIEKYRSHFQLE